MPAPKLPTPTRIPARQLPPLLRDSFERRMASIMDWADAPANNWLFQFIETRLAGHALRDPKQAIIETLGQAQLVGNPDGLILMSDQGVISFINDEAQAIVNANAWLTIQDNRLRGVNRTVQQKLSGAIAD